jgi:hypothetical protein
VFVQQRSRLKLAQEPEFSAHIETHTIDWRPMIYWHQEVFSVTFLHTYELLALFVGE